LGLKVALLQGKNSVHDKKTSSEVCAKFGLPYGFDGPMHAMGIMPTHTILKVVIWYYMEEHKA